MGARRTQQPAAPVDEAFAEELRQGYKHAQRCRELFLKITKVRTAPYYLDDYPALSTIITLARYSGS